MITLTEKRFFHWVEDDISVTLRNKSGSYGGGSEVLVIEIINSTGGGIAGTLDSHYYKGQGEREGTEREYLVVISKDNGASDGEQPSGELLRTRRV